MTFGLRTGAVILLAASASLGAAQQVLDRIAVVVGNTVITESEVIQEARLEAFLNQRPLDLSAAARKAAAERLVNQQLVRNEMSVGAYPAPTDAQVESALRNFRQEHFSSIPVYRASLAKYGISEDTLKKHLRWQLAAIQFTDMRFSPAVPGIPGDQTADRAIANSAPGKAAKGGKQAADQSANGVAQAAPEGANADERFDAWLKQARASTKIQFKPGAFQ